MAERKLVIYFESKNTDEDAFMEYVHRYFCENPNDPTTQDCPLYAMTVQDVVEEEG